jgi:hypothetical protein
VAEAAAAVFLRHDHAEHAELSEPFDHVLGDALFAIDQVGIDVFLEERFDFNDQLIGAGFVDLPWIGHDLVELNRPVQLLAKPDSCTVPSSRSWAFDCSDLRLNVGIVSAPLWRQSRTVSVRFFSVALDRLLHRRQPLEQLGGEEAEIEADGQFFKSAEDLRCRRICVVNESAAEGRDRGPAPW